MIPAMFALTVAVAISYPHALPAITVADLIVALGISLARPQ